MAPLPPPPARVPPSAYPPPVQHQRVLPVARKVRPPRPLGAGVDAVRTAYPSGRSASGVARGTPAETAGRPLGATLPNLAHPNLFSYPQWLHYKGLGGGSPALAKQFRGYLSAHGAGTGVGKPGPPSFPAPPPPAPPSIDDLINQKANALYDPIQAAHQAYAKDVGGWLEGALGRVGNANAQAQSNYQGQLGQAAGIFGGASQLAPGTVQATSPGGVGGSPNAYLQGAGSQADLLRGQATTQQGSVEGLLRGTAPRDLAQGLLANFGTAAAKIPSIYAQQKTAYVEKLQAAVQKQQDQQAQLDAHAATLAETSRHNKVAEGQAQTHDALAYVAKLTGGGGTGGTGSQSGYPAGTQAPVGYKAVTRADGRVNLVRDPSYRPPKDAKTAGGYPAGTTPPAGYVAVKRADGNVNFVKSPGTKSLTRDQLLLRHYRPLPLGTKPGPNTTAIQDTAGRWYAPPAGKQSAGPKTVSPGAVKATSGDFQDFWYGPKVRGVRTSGGGASGVGDPAAKTRQLISWMRQFHDSYPGPGGLKQVLAIVRAASPEAYALAQRWFAGQPHPHLVWP